MPKPTTQTEANHHTAHANLSHSAKRATAKEERTRSFPGRQGIHAAMKEHAGARDSRERSGDVGEVGGAVSLAQIVVHVGIPQQPGHERGMADDRGLDLPIAHRGTAAWHWWGGLEAWKWPGSATPLCPRRRAPCGRATLLVCEPVLVAPQPQIHSSHWCSPCCLASRPYTPWSPSFAAFYLNP